MNATRREHDLQLIDRISSDARASASERSMAEEMRGRLNDGVRTLSPDQRSMLTRLSVALDKRPPAERPSASSLLASMPLPKRPPGAKSVQFAEQKC